MSRPPMIGTAGARITDVAGIEVGHDHRIDPDAVAAGPDDPGRGWATGTTVVRIDAPDAVCAVDVRGGGPGTRETDLLDPVNTVQTAHAIVLTGGSAYGLVAADGVLAGLEEAGIGLPMDAHGHVVPTVPAAVIFDLPVGGWRDRPDAAFGRRALAATSTEFAVGSVGAGTGARAGSLKGGVGTASIRIDSGPAAGLTVGALMVANPAGEVIDPNRGLPWGATQEDLDRFGLRHPSAADVARLADRMTTGTPLNTTIGVVATDALLAPADTRRLAMSAHDGMARAVRPAHSPLDGDTVFAVSTGAVRQPRPVPGSPLAAPQGMNPDVAVLTELCDAAAIVTQRAIVGAVVAAESVAGVAAYRDLVASALR